MTTFFFYFSRNRKKRCSFSIVNIEIVLLQETPCLFHPFPDRLPRFTAIYFYIFKHVFRYSNSAFVPLATPKDNNAVLLVYKNRVIGGHITNGEYGSKNLPLVD